VERGKGDIMDYLSSEQVIYRLLNEYNGNNDSVLMLMDWVRSCLQQLFLTKEQTNYTSETKYKNCTIEFRSLPGVFNILKPQTVYAEPTGVVYDVTIFIASHTSSCFGVSDLTALKGNVQLDDYDIYDLSQDIAKDIDSWSNNIETIFKNSSSLSKS
jgi:hypothetical protein